MDWFYSPTDEANNSIPNGLYASEGVRFITYDRQMSLDMVELVQCWNSSQGHYLSVSGCGVDFVYDRPLGYIYSTPVSGTVPLYLFHESLFNRDFVTIDDTAEGLRLSSDGFLPATILGYVVSP